MAAGTKSNFKIYDEQFFGGMIEMIEQNANAFNAASNGTIVLQPERLIGDFEKESFVTTISNLITRRDITSVSAATDLLVAQAEKAGVKINRKIGPVAQTLDAFRKIGETVSPEVLSLMLGEQVGKAIAVDYINTAIIATRAALVNTAAVLYDYSATGTISHSVLVSGMAKFGDKAGDLSCWVMHSKPYFNLIGQSLTDKIFEVAGAVIYSGSVPTFGRPTLVIDAPALYTAGTPDKYDTLCLVPGGVVVKESEERSIVNEVVTGLENLVVRMQGEYAFNLGIKGYTWDTTNGGANPTDGNIGTGSNWDKVATDNKSLAGIIVKTQ
jgi:hypothetical protein